MRQAPMRRGLSPEGREIRSRHQGSLVIGSSCSIPLIKKSFQVEKAVKDSLSSSVSLPYTQPTTTKTGPFKVYPDNEADQHSITEVGNTSSIIHASGRDLKGIDRYGSAHSDYYSMSDEPLSQNQISQSVSHATDDFNQNIENTKGKNVANTIDHVDSNFDSSKVESNGISSVNMKSPSDARSNVPIIADDGEYLNCNSPSKKNLGSTYSVGERLEAQLKDGCVESVSDSVNTFLGNELYQRKLSQRYKNQELSADNPLTLNTNVQHNQEILSSSNKKLNPIVDRKEDLGSTYDVKSILNYNSNTILSRKASVDYSVNEKPQSTRSFIDAVANIDDNLEKAIKSPTPKNNQSDRFNATYSLNNEKPNQNFGCTYTVDSDMKSVLRNNDSVSPINYSNPYDPSSNTHRNFSISSDKHSPLYEYKNTRPNSRYENLSLEAATSALINNRSVLGRLHSSSSNKLLPATLVKPSEFTKSLRNSSNRVRETVSRSRPVRASVTIPSMQKNISPSISETSTNENIKNYKVSDIISKIRKSKPTCDVDYKTAQKEIERQHINLLYRRNGSMRSRSKSPSVNSKSSHVEEKNQSNVGSTRSKSVDRRSSMEEEKCTDRGSNRSNLSSRVPSAIDRNSTTDRNSATERNSTADRILGTDRNSTTDHNLATDRNSTTDHNLATDRNSAKSNVSSINPRKSPPVRFRNSNVSHMMRSKSNFTLNGETNSNPVKSVPPLNLDITVDKLHDCSTVMQKDISSENFQQKPSCSADDIRIPLQLDRSDDSNGVIASDKSVRENNDVNVGSQCEHEDTVADIQDEDYSTSTPRMENPLHQFDPSSAPVLKNDERERDEVSSLETKGHQNMNLQAPKRNVKNSERKQNSIGDPPSSYKRGHVPKYLQQRRFLERQQREAELAIDPDCPPNHTLLPDHQRLHTLTLLKDGIREVMREVSSLPIVQDTLRVQKKKKQLEEKLMQLEEGVNIFSQPKVFVMNDEAP